MENTSATIESERLRVLRLIEEGKVSATEGMDLLEAFGKSQKTKSTSKIGKTGPEWFRIRVTQIESGRPKATVNIPLGLAEWGLRIGAKYAPEIGDVNLAELYQMLDERGLDGKIIDVVDEADGEHVEIFIE